MKCDKQAVKVSFGKRNAKATKYKSIELRFFKNKLSLFQFTFLQSVGN